MPARSRLTKSTAAPTESKQHKYRYHLPLLAIGIACCVWLVLVLTRQFPHQVADVLLTNAYLPLLLPFFLSVTFITGYAALSIKIGASIGFFTTLLLFFRLQQIRFEWWWIALFISFFALVVYLEYSLHKNRQKQV